MLATIKFITEELNPFYPEREVQGFVRIIMESVCGLLFSQFILKQFREVTNEEYEKIKDCVVRLKRFEPIQYILGETEFYGLKFMVGPSVLIPRQETEELVDWIIKSEIKTGARVLDIGTGSGNIAISIKKKLPYLLVSAVDISEKVLALAIENAKINSVEIQFFVADILNHRKFGSSKYDVIISNPPYIREREKSFMNKNVLDYEPELALFVPDSDPIKFYKAISDFAYENLNTGGFLFFEINEALCTETSGLLKNKFLNLEIRKDINGKFRMIKAQKQETKI